MPLKLAPAAAPPPWRPPVALGTFIENQFAVLEYFMTPIRHCCIIAWRRMVLKHYNSRVPSNISFHRTTYF